jgi:hypothetical protein
MFQRRAHWPPEAQALAQAIEEQERADPWPNRGFNHRKEAKEILQREYDYAVEQKEKIEAERETMRDRIAQTMKMLVAARASCFRGLDQLKKKLRVQAAEELEIADLEAKLKELKAGKLKTAETQKPRSRKKKRR